MERIAFEKTSLYPKEETTIYPWSKTKYALVEEILELKKQLKEAKAIIKELEDSKASAIKDFAKFLVRIYPRDVIEEVIASVEGE